MVVEHLASAAEKSKTRTRNISLNYRAGYRGFGSGDGKHGLGTGSESAKNHSPGENQIDRSDSDRAPRRSSPPRPSGEYGEEVECGRGKK